VKTLRQVQQYILSHPHVFKRKALIAIVRQFFEEEKLTFPQIAAPEIPELRAEGYPQNLYGIGAE
jgi:hypothetical protein